MIRLFSFLAFISFTPSSYSQRIVVINKTGETIKAICLIEKDMQFKDFDSLIVKSQLINALEDGQNVTLDAQSKIYNIYAFTDKELHNANCYFIPFWTTSNKKLTLSKGNLESKFGGGEVVSVCNGDSPRVMIKIINETSVKLFSIYYKSHLSNKYESYSLIKSWDPINQSETRKVFFYPELKRTESEDGKVNYECFLDFKIVGFTEKGEVKTYLVEDFDCVNKEDINVK
jgi:hypothetical protein